MKFPEYLRAENNRKGLAPDENPLKLTSEEDHEYLISNEGRQKMTSKEFKDHFSVQEICQDLTSENLHETACEEFHAVENLEKHDKVDETTEVDFFDSLDLGGCEEILNVDSLEISGFDFQSKPVTNEISVTTEIAAQPEQEEREIMERQHLFSDSESDNSMSSKTSSSDEHELDESRRNSLESISSVNNKPKRPLFEKCNICDKSVKKMRDHLSNSHNMSTNPSLKQFLNSFYSTLATKKCFQCEVCLKRFSFKQTHPKHHKIVRIFNRLDQKLFPEPIQVALGAYKDVSLKLYQDVVDQFDLHVQGLADDGNIVSVYRMSSSFKQFLSKVIKETKEFDVTVNLSSCVRKYQEETGIQKTTNAELFGEIEEIFLLYRIARIFSVSKLQKSSLGKKYWTKYVKEFNKVHRKRKSGKVKICKKKSPLLQKLKK